eukprot:12936168-Prorocentrum_lima.AAC.1
MRPVQAPMSFVRVPSASPAMPVAKSTLQHVGATGVAVPKQSSEASLAGRQAGRQAAAAAAATAVTAVRLVSSV